MGYLVGVDFGQSLDYTALSVVEQTGSPSRYDVRHLERFPLGTPYPAVIGRLCGLMGSTLLHGSPLICDRTGVGAPLVDELIQAGLDPVAVTIVAGEEATRAENGWHVPKKDLVATVAMLLQTKRLRISQGLPDAATLVNEMVGFQVKITRAANAVYGAWREGSHDDVLLCVALSLWWGEYAPDRISAGWYAFARRAIAEGGMR